MSSITLVPLSQILAEVLTEDEVPQRAAARNRNVAVRIPTPQRVSNSVVHSLAQVEYFDDDRNHNFLPSEFNGDKDGVRSYAPPATVPRLIDMAASIVSIALWNHVTMSVIVPKLESPQNHYFVNYRSVGKKVFLLIKRLGVRVPKPMVNFIEKHITEVGFELDSWISYHSRFPFAYDNGDINWLYRFTYKMVWRSNGTIDRLQTAKNLLTSAKLTDVHKYFLSCLYCLVDELNSLWPSVSDKTMINATNDTLIHYWNAYFRKMLGDTQNSTVYSNNGMFKNPNVCNWPAKEYFFNRLTQQEQIENTTVFIDRSSDWNYWKYQKLLLMKLDDVQRVHIYAERIVQIMTHYASNRVDVREIYSTWHQARDTVTFADFVDIYKRLFESRYVGVTLLKFIWSSASEDFKIDFFYHNGHEMIDLALRLWMRNSQNDFFFTMMSDASENLKQKITTEPFFSECCVQLIQADRLLSFHRLLKFCLVKLEDFNRFKQDFVKNELFNNLCGQLLIEKKFQKLNTMINSLVADNVESYELKLKQDLVNSKTVKDYCLACYVDEKVGCLNINKLLTGLFVPSSPDFIAEYKKNLLMSSDGIDKCAALIRSKTNLIPIITDSLPTNDLVIEFLERLIFSPVALDNFRNLIKEQCLSDVNECIDRYLVKEEDKIKLKMRIIVSPVEMIRKVFRRFDNLSWESLLMWLVPSEEALSEFKSALPLDEIFNEMLKDCIFSKYDPSHRVIACKLRTEITFHSLDRFLDWYFESPAKVTEYKLRRIDSYAGIDAINTLLKKTDSRPIIAVVDWVFENNSEQLVKFKAKKKGEKIQKAIFL